MSTKINVPLAIEKLSEKYNLDGASLSESYHQLFSKWEPFVSELELLTLLVFSAKLKNEKELSKESFENLYTIAEVLNDKEKLIALNDAKIYGILNLDKSTNQETRELAAKIFNSTDIVSFLIELSEDQLKPNSIFLGTLDYLGSI